MGLVTWMQSWTTGSKRFTSFLAHKDWKWTEGEGLPLKHFRLCDLVSYTSWIGLVIYSETIFHLICWNLLHVPIAINSKNSVSPCMSVNTTTHFRLNSDRLKWFADLPVCHSSACVSVPVLSLHMLRVVIVIHSWSRDDSQASASCQCTFICFGGVAFTRVRMGAAGLYQFHIFKM